MRPLRIALAQVPVEDGEPQENLRKLEEVLARHASQHDLVVFPEAFLVGFPDLPRSRAVAAPIDGPLMHRLQELTTRHGVAVAAGLLERDGDAIYNTSVLVDQGELVLRHRKVHLWHEERPRVRPGRSFGSKSWRGTRIGLLVCYDMEFPEAARAVARTEAELIVVTDACMHPWGPIHDLAVRARALENQAFLAMTNRVGRQGDTVYVGESHLAGPDGVTRAKAGADEQVLSATIDLDEVRASRCAFNYLEEAMVSLRLTPAGDGRLELPGADGGAGAGR